MRLLNSLNLAKVKTLASILILIFIALGRLPAGELPVVEVSN